MPFTDRAICLRRSDYSETSLILRLMTREHGQVSLMAKGVKRPKSRFGGSIDLLSMGEAVFTLPRAGSVSTLGTLTDWSLLGHYPLLRQDLLRHSAGMTAAELLGRLTEELDPHPASFDAMARLLEALQASEPPLRRFVEFARTLLSDVGLTPGVERCVECGREALSGVSAGGFVLFSGLRGGVLCPQCRPAPGESTVKVSRQLCEFFTSSSSISGKLALEITRWVLYYVRNQIGLDLHTAAGLERAIASALAALAAESKSKP